MATHPYNRKHAVLLGFALLVILGRFASEMHAVQGQTLYLQDAQQHNSSVGFEEPLANVSVDAYATTKQDAVSSKKNLLQMMKSFTQKTYKHKDPAAAPVVEPEPEPKPAAPPFEEAESSQPPVASSSTANSCENGLQICRCHCRVDIPSCEDNEVSHASMPLCKEKWNNKGDCKDTSYFKTGIRLAQCGDLNGQGCAGYARPGNGNPKEIGNQKLDGRLLGCEVVAL